MKATLSGGWDVVCLTTTCPVSAPGSARTVAGQRDVPFIVSGFVGDEAAVAMMKAGAHDFVIKGSMARLVPAVNGLSKPKPAGDTRPLGLPCKKRDQVRALASIPGMVFQLLLETILRFHP